MNLYKYLLLCCLGILFACKKEIKPPVEPRPEPTEDDHIKADIYDYFNKYSLWTEQIPDRDEDERLAFVRQYRSNSAVLNTLMGLTPYYDGYKGSIDRFSFLDESGADGSISRTNGLRMDANDGYGLYLSWGILSETEEKAYPVVYLVEGGSPGQAIGMTRGSIVLEWNDDDEVTVSLQKDEQGNLVKDINGNYVMVRAEYNKVLAKINTGIKGSSLKIKVITPDDEEKTYTMTYKTYDIDPVLADTIYEDSNVGYMAYTSFEEIDNSVMGKKNKERIDNIVMSFAKANVKDLILDLRYNTGGYVETAEYLANNLVKSATDGKLMFTYQINDYLMQHNQRDFQDTYFSKKGSLELENLYVLVTENTASAAELLINILKPKSYLNVTLIAEGNRTYGKPVGFFPEKINDDVTLWVTSFKTINAEGITDYWEGMSVDYGGVEDYIFRDFGDPKETMIAKALSLAGVATTNSMRASSRKTGTVKSGVKAGIINQPRKRDMLKNK